MRTDWNPTEKHKRELEILDIPEPPCKHCIYWCPMRSYENFKYVKVRCCQSEIMFSDFSCYAEKGRLDIADEKGDM